MSESGYKKRCCVKHCPNTTENSNEKFFNFPEAGCNSYQRRSWLQALIKHNGPTRKWRINPPYIICSKHFVSGEPKMNPKFKDFRPNVFPSGAAPRGSQDGGKPRTVLLKTFALEYIKHDALLESPADDNINNASRCRAYAQLSRQLRVSEDTVRMWEVRFRRYFQDKVTALALRSRGALGAEAAPWMRAVERRLRVLGAGGGSPGGVLEALCATARALRTLCSTALYNGVKRALGLGAPLSDLHALWVRAQRVSLAQVVEAGRAGDKWGGAGGPGDAGGAGGVPRDAMRVADLVLLYTDVESHPLITDESVSLYEESVALHELWQLVQRHRVEALTPTQHAARARRWTRLHRDYLHSGRVASVIVLQRRWHELKLQARQRLAEHWRRLYAPAPGLDPASAPLTPPSPIHIAILKRFPHVARRAGRSWRQLAAQRMVVLEPLDIESLGESEEEVQEEASEDPPIDKHFTQSNTSIEQALADHTIDSQLTVIRPRDVECMVQQSIDSDTTLQQYNVNIIEHDDSMVNNAAQMSPDATKQVTVEIPQINKYIDVSQYMKAFVVSDDTVQASPLNSGHDNDSVAVDPTTGSATLHRTAVDDASTSYTNTHDVTDVKQVPGECRPVKHEPPDTEGLPAKRERTSNSSEDNLMIEEFEISPTNAPCVVKREQTEPAATVATHEPLERVLQTLDPSTVKTEIVFDSDDDELQAGSERDTAECPSVKVERLSDRLMFEDEVQGAFGDVTRDVGIEVPGVSSDVTSDSDLKEECSDQEPAVDPKLLMLARVQIPKIDETDAWRKYFNNQSIDVHKLNLYEETKHDNILARKYGLKHLSYEEHVARYRRNIKRELLDDDSAVLTDGGDADADNTAAILLKRKLLDVNHDENNMLEIEIPRLSTNNQDKVTSTKSAAGRAGLPSRVETSDSEDDTPLINIKKRKEREDGEWSGGFLHSIPSGSSSRKRSKAHGALAGAAVVNNKRVRLPDMEQVRRHYRGMLTAQVAPLTAQTKQEARARQEDAPLNSPEEEGALSELPPGDKLQDVLAVLLTQWRAEHVLSATYCCAARRHRLVNDARRRHGAPGILLHTHPDGECTCCCAHLCSLDARRSLLAQRRALHRDIHAMLRGESSTSSNKKQAKKSGVNIPQKNISRSCKPCPLPEKHTTSSTEISSKRVRKKNCAPPTPPPTHIGKDDYEEWQRQKTMNKQYFHISPVSTSKRKSAPNNTPTQDANVTATNTNVIANNLTTPTTDITSSNVTATDINITMTNITATKTNVTTSDVTTANTNITASNVTVNTTTPSNKNLTILVPTIQPTQQLYTNPPNSIQQPIIQPIVDYTNTIQTQNVLGMQSTFEPVLQPVVDCRNLQSTQESTSAPKTVSILEEYSRTLSQAPPCVNALSLSVPGPSGPRTTVVMAVNIPPAGGAAPQARLYADDVVDLTGDREDSPSQVLDVAGAFSRLVHSKRDKKAPPIMSLSKSVGDEVVEIDDSSTSNEGDDEITAGQCTDSNKNTPSAVGSDKSSKSLSLSKTPFVQNKNADPGNYARVLAMYGCTPSVSDITKQSSKTSEKRAMSRNIPSKITIKPSTKIKDNCNTSSGGAVNSTTQHRGVINPGVSSKALVKPGPSSSLCVKPSSCTNGASNPTTSSKVAIKPSISNNLATKPCTCIKVSGPTASSTVTSKTSTTVAIKPTTAGAVISAPSTCSTGAIKHTTPSSVANKPCTCIKVANRPSTTNIVASRPTTPNIVASEASTSRTTTVASRPTTYSKMAVKSSKGLYLRLIASKESKPVTADVMSTALSGSTERSSQNSSASERGRQRSASVRTYKPNTCTFKCKDALVEPSASSDTSTLVISNVVSLQDSCKNQYIQESSISQVRVKSSNTSNEVSIEPSTSGEESTQRGDAATCSNQSNTSDETSTNISKGVSCGSSGVVSASSTSHADSDQSGTTSTESIPPSVAETDPTVSSVAKIDSDITETDNLSSVSAIQSILRSIADERSTTPTIVCTETTLPSSDDERD